MRLPLPRRFARAWTWTLVALVAACAPAGSSPEPGFAALVERLSEPGGYFDTDNLVSNETAYLHVMDGLRGVHGGVYLGVGPEQNFSYIAAIEPELSLLIDIRRDNLLLHLLFKALFEGAHTRIEYLATLFGRVPPASPAAWTGRSLEDHLAYLDTAALVSDFPALHRDVMRRVESSGVPLTDQDRQTLDRFHEEFHRAGLGLAFSTLGRPAQREYPTIRRLYLETDLAGRRQSYLATEARWRRVRDLEASGRVVPVVGDLGGTQAMGAIADYLRATGRKVSAFYVSNVEFYLVRDGSFPQFIANMAALPAEPNAVLIRSWFDRGFPSPTTQAGHFSSQHLQRFRRFLELAATPGVSYRMMVFDRGE